MSRQAQRWTRDAVCDAIRRWEALYGHPPAAYEWNVAMARRNGRPDAIVRYRSGDWPSYTITTKRFATWNDAIRAAGCRARPQGERVEEKHDPIPVEDLDRAEALYARGYGLYVISEQLGVTQARLDYALRKRGFTPRTTSQGVALANRRKHEHSAARRSRA